MWERLKEWLQRRMAAGVQDGGAPLDDFVARYEDGQGENITAIIAGKLAMLSFADSALAVEDVNCPEAPGARVQLIRELLTELWHSDAGWITAQMLGKGGNLCIKASDGNYYSIDVDESGNVSATKTTVSSGEISAGQTSGGRVILETKITAANLNTSNLLATYALINKIDAARIDVAELFAQQAFVDALYTSKIYGGKSLEMIAGQVAQNATDIANIETLDIYTGDNPPELPLEAGKLWIDTGVTPTVIRRWKGTGTSTDRDEDGWDTVSDLEEINEISNRLIAQQAEAQKAIDQLATAITIDTSGAHFYKPGYRDRSEVRIDQDSVDILVGGNVNSSFIAGGLILGNYMLWHPAAAGGLAFNLM